MRLNTFYILVDNALKFWSADLTESYITGCFEEEPTPPTAELLWLDIPPELTPPSSTMFSVQIVCNFDRYESKFSWLILSGIEEDAADPIGAPETRPDELDLEAAAANPADAADTGSLGILT